MSVDVISLGIQWDRLISKRTCAQMALRLRSRRQPPRPGERGMAFLSTSRWRTLAAASYAIGDLAGSASDDADSGKAGVVASLVQWDATSNDSHA